MVQGVFTKNNRRVFLIVLLIVALVSIGAAVGSFLFFGRSVDGNDLTEGFGSKLSYGNSFSLKDITEEEEYKYEWINANGVDVKVYALNADGESVETDDILAYSKGDHSFEVIGVSSGTIRFTSVLDDTVTFSVSFTTSFASPDTEEILAENYPHFFEDGIITRSELMEIRSLRIESRSSVDLKDIKGFSGLIRLEIRNVPEDNVISVANFDLPEETSVYVEGKNFLAYLAQNDAQWSDKTARIFPLINDPESHSVVLFKDGGALTNDDDGLAFVSFEVEDGGSVALSEEYAIKKEGYRFLGWYTEDGDRAVTDGYEFTSDLKLKAKWQANTYTVRLHNNDKTDQYTEKTFAFGESGPITDRPPSYLTEDRQPSGRFLQIGWAYDPDSEKADFENRETVGDLSSEDGAIIDVYAVWVYKDFSIQFYSWDTEKEYKPYGSPVNVSLGDEFVLSLTNGKPSSPYGSYKGWALSANAVKPEYDYEQSIVPLNEKLLLSAKSDGVLKVYAVFQLEEYDIIYVDAGNSEVPPRMNGISRGVSVNLHPPIEKHGYKFMGWEDESGTIWTSAEIVSSDTGFFNSKYPSTKCRQMKINADGFVLPSGIETVTVTAQVKLKAVWKANTFTVRFSGDKTSSTYYNDATVEYGKDFSFTGTLSKTGHSLKSCVSNIGSIKLSGRVLTQAQVNTLYDALKGTSSDNDFYKLNNRTVVFNVSWEANRYKVTFDYQGGSGGESEKTVTYLSTYGTLPTPTKADKQGTKDGKKGHWSYTFNSWKDDSEKVILSNTVVNTASDHKLTAQWDSTWHPDGTCLATGTQVTMADGTNKGIEDVEVGDLVRVWDFEQGCYSSTVVAYIEHNPEEKLTVVDLEFADGTVVTLITEHGFFDCDTREFEYFNPENAESFIGHRFFKMTEENGTLGYAAVELTNVVIEERIVGTHSMVTANQLSHFANDYLSIAAGIDGLFNIFEIGEDMRYDEEAMQRDIETYGLYSYDVFADYVSYEEYVAFGGAVLKVSVGKGLTTLEDIVKKINKYLK